MIPARTNLNSILPEILDSFFGSSKEINPFHTTPSMNILENKEGYRIEVAAPGAGKEDFNVNLNDNGDLVLTLEKKTEESEEKKGQYLRHDFEFTKYSRTLELPEDVQRSGISAKVENGILTVSIPKIEKVSKENRNRSIEIA